MSCGRQPYQQLLGDWERANNDPVQQAMERAKLPMPEQRTIFRFGRENVAFVEHWLSKRLERTDTNWYRLSADGTLLETIAPFMQDTLRMEVRKLTADTLELGLEGTPVPFMVLVPAKKF
jgi:hypothetical protein